MTLNYKISIILTFSILSFWNVNAQEKTIKPNIEAFSYKEWPELTNGTLSNDGDYAFCKISNRSNGANVYLIKSLDRHQEKYLPSTYNLLNFSNDSKSLYTIHGDTLSTIDLLNFEESIITGCVSYELYTYNNIEWLVYQLNDGKNTLVARKLNSKVNYRLQNVKAYFFNKIAQTIVLKINTTDDTKDSLQWIDLKEGMRKDFYYGVSIDNLIFDQSGKNLAFSSDSNGIKSIWYFNYKMHIAESIANDKSDGILDGYSIATDTYWQFSSNGKSIYFTQQKKEEKKEEKKIALPGKPDIWSYQDRMMLPEYKRRGEASFRQGENFTVVNINRKQIDLILPKNQRVISTSYEKANPNLILIETLSDNMPDIVKVNSQSTFSLYNFKSRHYVEIDEQSNFDCYSSVFSPINDYMIYYNPAKSCFVSFCLATGKRQDFKTDKEDTFWNARILGWTNDSHLLVCGWKDIWELDIKDMGHSRNISSMLNAKQEITFSLAALTLNQFSEYKSSNDILFVGFDSNSKSSSLYVLNSKRGKFIKVFDSNFYLSEKGRDIPFLYQSKTGNKYLLKMGNVSNFPNYYVTSDFKKFDTLTYFEPQNKYNWITSELMKYKNISGKDCEGILYKPTNFNPSKKYPILFDYYQEQSNTLNNYISPEPVSDGINIPLLIANGYIVMRPNMYPEPNEPGEGALRSILAAVDHLGKFSWADTTKMGITGHSFGGFETNYIITHCNRFRVAFSGAGVVNMIESYTDVTMEGAGWQWYSLAAYKMQDRLENIPEQYVKNSPILFTKNLKTPLLIIHNDGDHRVAVAQSKQFYNQLRSQHLPVWLLQYKGEKHNLNNEANQLDLQNRVLEFFDHYLNGKAMPQWMIDHH